MQREIANKNREKATSIWALSTVIKCVYKMLYKMKKNNEKKQREEKKRKRNEISSVISITFKPRLPFTRYKKVYVYIMCCWLLCSAKLLTKIKKKKNNNNKYREKKM